MKNRTLRNLILFATLTASASFAFAGGTPGTDPEPINRGNGPTAASTTGTDPEPIERIVIQQILILLGIA